MARRKRTKWMRGQQADMKAKGLTESTGGKKVTAGKRTGTLPSRQRRAIFAKTMGGTGRRRGLIRSRGSRFTVRS